MTAAVALPAASMDIFAASLGNYQKYHDGEGQTLKQKIMVVLLSKAEGV